MSNIEKLFDQSRTAVEASFKRRGQVLVDKTGITSKLDLFNTSLRQIKVIRLVRQTKKPDKTLTSISIIENKSDIITIKDNIATRNGEEDKALSKLLQRVDLSASILRRSGCKCGYETRNNPNAYGCRSRFCVKNKDNAKLNNVRFLNAAMKRGSQRVSYSPRRLKSSGNEYTETNRRVYTKAA